MRAAALVFLVLFTALPAAAAPACLQRTQTSDFEPLLGARSVIVTDHAQRKFKVSFAGPCRALEDAPRLGFRTLEQSRLACVEKDDYLVSLRDADIGNGARSCAVQQVIPYTREMEKADAVAKAMDRVAQ
jgi:hypothetical protein